MYWMFQSFHFGNMQRTEKSIWEYLLLSKVSSRSKHPEILLGYSTYVWQGLENGGPETGSAYG